MNDSDLTVIVDAFGLTDVGMVRKNNEDAFLILDASDEAERTEVMEANKLIASDENIFIVADGMGGVQAGEIASRMAVELIPKLLRSHMREKRPASRDAFAKILKATVEEANRLLLQAGQSNRQHKGMGTTLTAASLYGSSIFFAQLGDSRAYLLRNGIMNQMTKDQSLVAQMVASGTLTPEEAKIHPQRNVILQALGIQPQINVVISCAELKRRDQLVLCSDGLWGKIDDEEIKEFIEKYDPATACHSLVGLARERGGEDNITVIVASFDGDRLPFPEPEAIPNCTEVMQKPRWFFWPWRR